MSGPEGDTPPPPPPNADNPPSVELTPQQLEIQRLRDNANAKIEQIAWRKTALNPSITPRQRIEMPLTELVRSERQYTKAEDVFLGQNEEKMYLVTHLKSAHVEPGNPGAEDPLIQKISQVLNPDDAKSVSSKLITSISMDIIWKGRNNQTVSDPKEDVEWLDRWQEFLDTNPAVLQQARLQVERENSLLNLSYTIDGLARGAEIDPSSIARDLEYCEFTPEQLSTDPLARRLFEVVREQGGDEVKILAEIQAEIKSKIDLADPAALPPWLQGWARVLSNPAPPPMPEPMSSEPPRQPRPAYDPFASTPTPDMAGASQPVRPEGGPPPRSVTEVDETSEDMRAAEAVKVAENREIALVDLVKAFEEKAEVFPGLEDEKYTNLSLLAVINKLSTESYPPNGLPYEVVLRHYDDVISGIARNLVSAQIDPENQNPDDDLYATLNLTLSPQDKAQVMQKVMYSVYRQAFGRPHDRSDPDFDWIEKWQGVFTADVDLVKQLKWQHSKNIAQQWMCTEISELRRGDHKSDGAIIGNLYECRIPPDQFDNHPFVRQLMDILGPRWDTVRLKYFQEISHSYLPSARPDSSAIVTDTMSQPESYQRAFLESWLNDPRVSQLRAGAVPPETSPPPASPEAAKTKWYEKFGDLIAKSSKQILERAKKINAKDAILGKVLDADMAVLIGVAVRGLASSDPSWGPMIARFAGGAFGAYHAFNREVNNRYQKVVSTKAARGDADASTELDKVSKENILQKEKFLKKECWKRFSALPGKDKSAAVGYTLMGAFVGAVVADIGYEGMEMMYMQQDKSVIENFFANTFYDFFQVPRPIENGDFRGGLKR